MSASYEVVYVGSLTALADDESWSAADEGANGSPVWFIFEVPVW